MKRHFLSSGLVLIFATSNAWAQTAPSAVELAVQAKKLEADTKKQLEIALAKKQEAEAALKAAAEKKASVAAPAAPAAKTAAKSATATPAPDVITAADAKKLSTVAATAGIAPLDIKGMDLETAMMQVQSNRANLLEAQLKEQIAAVQAKNDKIAKMNSALAAANRIAAQFPAGAKATAPTKENVKAADLAAWERAAQDADIKPGDMSTKGTVDGQVKSLKSQIDLMANSQQMDMLRLQSLSNKRNEAFETMTNFIKKMQDNRASIVGKMR